MMAMRAATILSFVVGVRSHGAMTFPRPRNALDGDLAPWTNWSFPCDAAHRGDMCAVSFCCSGTDCQGSCGKSAHSGVEGALTGSNGQACYYFSNGCTPGCDECDGTVNHHGRGGQQFLYKGMNQSYINDQKIVIPDLFNPKPGDMVLHDPATKHTLHPGTGVQDAQRAETHDLQEQPADGQHPGRVRIGRRRLLLDAVAGPRLSARDRLLWLGRWPVPRHGHRRRGRAVPKHDARQDRAEGQRAPASDDRQPSDMESGKRLRSGLDGAHPYRTVPPD